MTEHVVDLDLELLSPCFLGGAYQQPEFRMASLRGVWRYWYRALYGDGTESRDVNGEADFFGGVHGEGGRMARGRLAPRPRRESPDAPGGSGQPRPLAWEPGRPPRGRDYLLFTMGMNRRAYLPPGRTIELQCRIRGPVESELMERGHRSLAVALAFGGVGARSRRMAGAVHLSAREPHAIFGAEPAPDPQALAARLKALIAPLLSRELRAPRYHVVARGHFRAGVLREAFRSWGEALDEVGSALREFRLKRPPDYGLAKELVQGRPIPPGSAITRAAFGLPLTFRFRSLGGRSTTIQLPDSDRRGSPLFLTLEKLQGGRLAVVWSLFGGPLSAGGSLLVRETRAPLAAPGQDVVEQLLREPVWASHLIAE